MPTKKRIIIISVSIVGLIVFVLLVIMWIRKPPAFQAPSFLPGVYSCEAGNEFCRIRDTFVIHRTILGGVSYNIIRKSSFARIRKGKTDAPEYLADTCAGIYDPENRMLICRDQNDTARVFTISYWPKLNKVYKNDFIYEKIE